jgi:hypothetical protein
MKFCKTCKKIINTDMISLSIFNIKGQCMDCSSVKAKIVSMEEYTEMKQRELEEQEPGSC